MAEKEIASIEILHLDEPGYGPEGKHTRREWREECLTNLLAGKDQFLAWQESWKALAEQNDRKARFGLVVSYEDGTKRKFFDESYIERASHALDFNGSHFKVRVNCQQFHFQFASLFGFARFSGNAYFNESQFSGYAYFSESQFSGYADFSASQFSGDANFSESQFLGDANFSASQFSGYANFSASQFSDEADFSASQFSGYANFRASQLSGTADFSVSQFSGYADFRASQFSGDTYFSKAGFPSGSNFSETTFKLIAHFENASFANVGHFEQAKFEGEIPAFRGCKIDATRLEFSDESYFTQADFSEDAIKNISSLKRLADQHGQVDQAIEFNAMELRAKRQYRLKRLNQLSILERLKSGDWWATHATWVYAHVSDFGRSFTTPLKGYLALLGVTWLLALVCAIGFAPQLCLGQTSGFFALELARYNTCENPDAVRPPKQLVFTGYTAASEYTLYRASGFIYFADKGKQVHDINRRLFDSPVEPWFMRIWGLVTSLLSTIFFFFIALGLRNRYRIK